MSITAHCLVVNEENFIWYAIKSVIDFVDKIIIFDTGSTDKTVAIIESLANEYPNKIIFEEKGQCNKKQHTELRQEMIDRTTTDWFMILDGDEVWTIRSMQEAIKTIQVNSNIDCLIAPFYLCVGDVFHRYYAKGSIEMLGKKDFFYPRFIKMKENVHWDGDYNQDVLVFADGREVFRNETTIILQNRYWHLTHLKRSALDDQDFSSYGSRKEKRRETYFILGRRIKESVPEVFNLKPGIAPLGGVQSFVNFIKLIFAHQGR